MKNIIFILIITTAFLGCVGKESLGIDKLPPKKPNMIQHLGDSGDTINEVTNVNFYNNTEFEENGIDAVPDGNKIKIEWEHLLDTDLDYLKVYRFSEADYLADNLEFASIIDTVDYTGQDYYRDDFLGVNSITHKNWFYFIEIFDKSGNSTLSDTVCYRLLEKPLIISPAEISEVNSLNDIFFEWTDSDAQQYRILLFNSNREILWQYELLAHEETQIAYSGSDWGSGDYIFRIDAFGHLISSSPINGKTYSIIAGAESEERVIIVE